MDCADADCIVHHRFLRRTFRLRLRTRNIEAHGFQASVRTHPAHGEALSIIVLASFTIAMLVAFVAPRVAFVLICCALIFHLRPDAAPGNCL